MAVDISAKPNPVISDGTQSLLYLPSPGLRREPRRTLQVLEAPQTDAFVAESAGMFHHAQAQPRPMLHSDVPPANISPPAWAYEPGTNIHGGTFVGGNVNYIKSSGESGAFIRQATMVEPLTMFSS
jgi:hypothetical protein